MRKSILVVALFFLVITAQTSQAALVDCLYGSATITLAKIDPLDGSCTTIISGNYPTFNGLTFNSNDGFIYGSSTGSLMRIDPDDGSYSTIIQSNYPTFNGLAYTPEPATLLLLGLGAVMLRRKRRAKRPF